jgi:hypothetical protein
MTADQFLVLLFGILLVTLAMLEFWKPQLKAVI